MLSVSGQKAAKLAPSTQPVPCAVVTCIFCCTGFSVFKELSVAVIEMTTSPLTGGGKYANSTGAPVLVRLKVTEPL